MFMQRNYSLKAQNQRSDIRDSISIDRYCLQKYETIFQNISSQLIILKNSKDTQSKKGQSQ